MAMDAARRTRAGAGDGDACGATADAAGAGPELSGRYEEVIRVGKPDEIDVYTEVVLVGVDDVHVGQGLVEGVLDHLTAGAGHQDHARGPIRVPLRGEFLGLGQCLPRVDGDR